MEHENFANSLRAFQRRTTFQPYVVHFVDGERILVEHPEAVRYQGMGTAVTFGKEGEITLFDHLRPRRRLEDRKRIRNCDEVIGQFAGQNARHQIAMQGGEFPTGKRYDTRKLCQCSA